MFRVRDTFRHWYFYLNAPVTVDTCVEFLRIRAGPTNSVISFLCFLLPRSCMTDDGFPSALLNRRTDRQRCVCVRCLARSKRACTGILSLPASLRDNERRYIDHRPQGVLPRRKRANYFAWMSSSGFRAPIVYTGCTTAHRVSFLIGKVFLTPRY